MNETKIVALLKGVKRDGIDDLIECMEAGGFFKAPCSGQYHLTKEGGLAEHSLNVYQTMLMVRDALGTEISDESVIICGILHDLGKMGDHSKPNYIENVLKSGKISDSKPYITNPALSYVPHEIRSIAIAQRYIRLTEEEEFAILYHNGLYTALGNSYKGKETPMSLMLHFADMWCSRVVEDDGKGEEE